MSCLNGTTFQSLKLCSTPTCSSSRFAFPSLHQTHKSPFPRLIKALSTTVQASPSTTKVPDEHGGKSQWKAAIDFKWIKDNNEAVAANIKNRNSDANLDLVLHLYDQMFNLQKVMLLLYLFLTLHNQFKWKPDG